MSDGQPSETENAERAVSEPSLDDAAASPGRSLGSKSERAGEAEREMLRRRVLLDRFWGSAKDFWSLTSGDRLAWPLTAGVSPSSSLP